MVLPWAIERAAKEEISMKKNYVGGKWVSSKESTPNINPSDVSDIIGHYARGTRADVEAAIVAARKASPAWGASSVQQRSEILETAGHEVMARRDELGRLLAREEGKTLPEAIGEVTRAAQVLKFFAGESVRIQGERLASTRPGVEIDITREPLGVVGIVTPWNFPIAIPAWKIAPAIAYGNCVVFKPADLVPGSAWALVDILVRAGLPSGVLNLVMGQGSEVGAAIIESPDVDAVSFTGSESTGKYVAETCARTLTKFQLEMGGKNPFVVLDDADLDIAVECAINSAFYSTGQRCTASSRLIVTDGIHDRFVAAMVAHLSKLRVGDALAEGTDIGPVVDARQLNQNLKYVEIGRQESAKIAFGGEPVNTQKNGFYMQPVLFTETTNDMRINQDEIFGPIASVIRVRSYEEALEVANDTKFGLSSGIATTSLKYASHFRRHAQAGLVMVNLPTAGADYHVPFGGRKGSSYGPREQGRYAAEFYTTVKTAYIRPGEI